LPEAAKALARCACRRASEASSARAVPATAASTKTDAQTTFKTPGEGRVGRRATGPILSILGRSRKRRR
jgi:hypothetical protein